MFIATANVIDNIPYPLLDRMDMISLSGYTENEKVDIANSFLMPKLLKEHALKKDQVKLSDSLLRRIIDEYTKEAGVRSLERILAKLMRKVIQQLLAKKQLKKVEITDALVEEWFGVPPYRRDDRKNEEGVGIAVGLAWTEVGGDTLDIEVAILKGKGALTLTGQLGEVMQESAQAAMSYIRSREKALGLKEGFYSDVDVHMHLPEGAIPKDGPSAGITMVTALVSALTGIPARADLAMTGEVTLRGRVLAIGGLKEKLLAAIRLGMKTALVPKANERDVKEFESELENKIKIVFVDSMDDVLKLALVRSPFDAAAKKATKAKSKTILTGKKPAAKKKAVAPKKKKK
jgi:ATP-dependent Lon protease